jgi:hypothetical protein
MLIYRFRITAADHEDFLREIEIQPGQTFLELHHLLAETAEAKNITAASFSTSDKTQKVKHEITLKPVQKPVRRYDDDLGEVVIEKVTLPLMKDARIKNFIEDPHQLFIYEIQAKDSYRLSVELFKIAQSEGVFSYPRISRRSGELRKVAELQLPPVLPETEDLPPAPRPQKPKTPVSAPVAPIPPTTKLDHIEEDLDEIKAIDEELSDLLEEEAPVTFEVESQIASTDDGEEEGFEGEEMEHLEDFGDMDRIDEHYSGYRESPDDY